MDNMFELAKSNLSSPVILFFLLGILISLIRAKVQIPSAISDFITLYLLIGIGFKGGVAVSEAGLSTGMLLTVLAALALGLIIPIYSYYLLRFSGKLKSDDAAAIAGHYGSVSVVTFMAATTFLNNLEISYEGYMNGVPALMEVPAIVIALLLAAWHKQKNKAEQNEDENSGIGSIIKQVILSKSVVLLLGAMFIGYFSGSKGMESVGFFYKDIFMGMLSLFMLEMGIIAATKIGELKYAGKFLLLFGILTPVLNGVLGIFIGLLTGLGTGGIALLAVLAASSSYIVAPAAMRVSLPKANPAFYLGASLGITLPFNLIVGIPLYYFLTIYISNLIRGG